MEPTSRPMSSAETEISRSPRDKVVRRVQEWIKSGALRPGDFLPSERQLADQLGVARLTARYALIDLQRDGVLETVNRKRRLVAQSRRSALAQAVILVSTARYSPAIGWESRVQVQVEEDLQRQGFNPMLFNPRASSPERLYALLDEEPAGFIIFADASEHPAVQEFVTRAVAAGRPVIVQSGSEQFRDAIRVTSDHEAGAYELTRCLISRGCRRILRFWARPVKTEWIERRDAGVERALKEAGLPVIPELLGAVMDRQGEELPDQYYFTSRTRQMLGFLYEHLNGPDRVDGILVLSDPDALTAANACRIAGLEPNRDILVGGYDHCWSICPEYFFEKTAPAATIDKCNDRIGKELVAEFLKEASGSGPGRLILVPPVLVPLAESSRP